MSKRKKIKRFFKGAGEVLVEIIIFPFRVIGWILEAIFDGIN
jgi:hypothetical protein